MFDMLEELVAIHRSVALDEAAGTVTVALSRTYDADSEDVWDALTNPERLPHWFYPVSGDLRVGGTFQLDGNAGGEIRRCNRPTWLQVTFGGPDSILDLRLSEIDGKTTVELGHTVPWRWQAAGRALSLSAPAGTVRYSDLGSVCAGRPRAIRRRPPTPPR
jgi:uncharacterized protein YndB with AHSA1/START domain